MKCLQLSGDRSLVEGFIRGMAECLPDRPVFIVRREADGTLSISCPGIRDLPGLLGSMPPDTVIVTGPPELAAPVVWCGQDPPEELAPLLLEVCSAERGPVDYRGIFNRLFNLLPQRRKNECGRCGTDCRGLAAAILKGTRKSADCFFSPGRLEVLQDGRSMELGEFPSRILESALRGLLSPLKGYSEGSAVTVRLEPVPERT